MKVTLITICLVLHTLLAGAQEMKGIKFEKGLSWSQIKEKAKKENKYIFLDAYTTWCGPCKMMSREIFTEASVGQYFNKNFINVAVQLDITAADDQAVKSWYQDAAALRKLYQLDSYPAYLFFNPQAELVHSIYGAIPVPEEFIRISKEAFNPRK